MTFFSDNKSAIILANNHQYFACTKHINICYYFIHWTIEKGKIWLIYCSTKDIIADVFTKALFLPKVKHFTYEVSLTAV